MCNAYTHTKTHTHTHTHAAILKSIPVGFAETSGLPDPQSAPFELCCLVFNHQPSFQAPAVCPQAHHENLPSLRAPRLSFRQTPQPHAALAAI